MTLPVLYITYLRLSSVSHVLGIAFFGAFLSQTNNLATILNRIRLLETGHEFVEVSTSNYPRYLQLPFLFHKHTISNLI